MNVIELFGRKFTVQATGNGNPPDRQRGQATCRSTVWVKLDDGPWVQSCERSQNRTFQRIVNARTADEAMASVEGKPWDANEGRARE